MLKWSAHLRGIAWELSFEDFCSFNDVTGYVERKGLNGDSLTIDRIREDGPYCLDNIQPLSRSFNSTKGNHFYHNRQKRESKPRGDQRTKGQQTQNGNQGNGSEITNEAGNLHP